MLFPGFQSWLVGMSQSDLSTEHKASDWKFLHPILDYHGLREVILPLSQCPHGNSSNSNFPAESKSEALGLFNHIEHVPHCRELRGLMYSKSLLLPFQKKKMRMRRKGMQNCMQSWGSTGTPSIPATLLSLVIRFVPSLFTPRPV